MTLAKRWCALGSVALLALQAFWHGWLAPPASGPAWLAVAIGAVPILPALALFALRHPRAPFWAAVASLLYFSHGVMEAWVDPAAWTVALAQAAIAAWTVVTASWDGLRARLARRRAAPPSV